MHIVHYLLSFSQQIFDINATSGDRFKTYDYDRAYCDAEFFENMKSQCRDGLAPDPRELARCFSAALQFHEAVRQRGESSFLGPAGKYCEYAGPPTMVSGR